MTKQNKENIIIKSISEMRAYSSAAKARGEQIGLVPTMGALHEGHLSLIHQAVSENDIAVVSIFVNPIQFDDQNDFSAYPVTLEADAEASFGAGANAVFAPSANEMYPDGFSTYIDMTGISEKLCGASRPFHFRGVLTVVAKLFGACTPDKAYFGEKDAQQLAVVRKMASELCMNVSIRDCPTIREYDGLAMSSRNERLDPYEREAASCLFRALLNASALFATGEDSADVLIGAMRNIINTEPLARIDYAEIVNPSTFEAVSTVRKGDLLAIAVFIGETRLIDNRRLL